MNNLFYKNTVLFILILLGSISLRAQVNSQYGFGIKAGLNYTTIGSRFGQYSGSGEYALGIFGTKTLTPRLFVSMEPTFTVNSFRQVQSDNRYKYTYVDANLNAYYDLFNTEDIFMYLGIRPGYLLNYRSEILQGGTYISDNNAVIKNKEGQVALGVNAGMTVRLSRVISLDLGYVWSSNNKTTLAHAEGRPSFFEVSLKLNAVDLKSVMEQQDQAIVDEIKTYQKGAMLVMLQTYSEKDFSGVANISWNLALKDPTLMGFKMTSWDIKQLLNKDLKVLNTHIMNEFKRNFTFAPVYFFMDTSLNKLLLGDTKGIFVNEHFETDPGIVLADTQNFFVTGFTSDLSSSTQKINYGMYVYNNKMQPLDKPFNMNNQAMGVYFSMSPFSALSDIMKLTRTLASLNIAITEDNILTARKGLFQSMAFSKNIKRFNERLLRYTTLN